MDGFGPLRCLQYDEPLLQEMLELSEPGVSFIKNQVAHIAGAQDRQAKIDEAARFDAVEKINEVPGQKDDKCLQCRHSSIHVHKHPVFSGPDRSNTESLVIVTLMTCPVHSLEKSSPELNATTKFTLSGVGEEGSGVMGESSVNMVINIAE